MSLLRKSWKKLFKNHIKINLDYLFAVVFDLALCAGGIWLMYVNWNVSEQEIIDTLQLDMGANSAQRKRIIYVIIIDLFGKEGLLVFISLCLYIIIRHFFLPNLRKFLGKEVEKEEENEE